MRKHLFTLSLTLLMIIWGGQTAWADVSTYSVTFNTASANTIPTGWTVYHDGTERASGSSQTSGSRLFNFSNSVQTYKNFLYLGVSYNADASKVQSSYALYGGVTDYSLNLTAGNYELSVPAFLWKNGGSHNLVVKLTKSTDTGFDSPILNKKKGVTYNASGDKSADLSGIRLLKFQFTISDGGDYLLMLGAENVGNSELMIGGFSIKATSETSSTYDNTLVLEETFADVLNNYTPASGSGWRIYKEGTALPQETSYSSGTRIRNSENVAGLSKNFYGTANDYLIYGEALGSTSSSAPSLHLDVGTYLISYYAAGWTTSAPISTLTILNSSNEVVVTKATNLSVYNNSGKDAITPNHIQALVTIQTAGYYQLKFSSDAPIVLGNISVRKNSELTPISSQTAFYGLSGATPAATTGWTVYDDSGSPITADATSLSNARIASISGGGDVTNVAYLRYGGALTYGEVDDVPLSLIGGKEYRLSYYAACQEDTKCSVTCTVKTTDSDGLVFEPLKRTDYLAGNIIKWAVDCTMDYIETTFTPSKSGDYILKFTGTQVHVANITLKENCENPAVYTTKLDGTVGYSTLYVDQPVSIPSNVHVYSAAFNDATNPTKIILTEITGAIPANTAVIVKGTVGASVSFTPATSLPSEVTGNILQGNLLGTVKASDIVSTKDSTYTDNGTEIEGICTTTTTYTYYTLAYDPDESDVSASVGFYINDAAVLRANKAYIVISGTESTLSPKESTSTEKTVVEEIPAFRFDFGSGETENISAIEQVRTEETTIAGGPIYGLNGRRVADLSKPGLYIVGGRKVLVK